MCIETKNQDRSETAEHSRQNCNGDLKTLAEEITASKDDNSHFRNMTKTCQTLEHN